MPLAASAKIRCRSKFPLRRAPSNCHWRRKRGCDKIIVCGPGHRWIPSPDRQEIKRHADDKERNRKMNDDWVLRVSCERSSLYVKHVHTIFREILRHYDRRGSLTRIL